MTIRKSHADYLEAIYVLQGRSGLVRSVDVARHLGFSKASVCTMLSVLIERGYIEKSDAPPYALALTETGSRIAAEVYERHCWFRDELVRAGVDGGTAEREACELEHAISAESFSLLRRAQEDRRSPGPNA